MALNGVTMRKEVHHLHVKRADFSSKFLYNKLGFKRQIHLSLPLMSLKIEQSPVVNRNPL